MKRRSEQEETTLALTRNHKLTAWFALVWKVSAMKNIPPAFNTQWRKSGSSESYIFCLKNVFRLQLSIPFLTSQQGVAKI